MSDRRPTDKHLEEMAADSDGIGGAVPVMARELLELRGVARDRRDEIVCLQAELESKRAQHAETLGLLEHAYKVIEALNQPPLGYVAMSRPKDSDGPYGILIGRNLATDKLAAEMQRHRFEKDEDMNVIVAELREVPDAG